MVGTRVTRDHVKIRSSRYMELDSAKPFHVHRSVPALITCSRIDRRQLTVGALHHLTVDRRAESSLRHVTLTIDLGPVYSTANNAEDEADVYSPSDYTTPATSTNLSSKNENLQNVGFKSR